MTKKRQGCDLNAMTPGADQADTSTRKFIEFKQILERFKQTNLERLYLKASNRTSLYLWIF